MKYEVGDKVIIKKNLTVGKDYGNDCFATGMICMLGKKATIASVSTTTGKYRIKEAGYNWTDEMIERKARC